MNRKLLLAIPAIAIISLVAGCEPKDVDPGQKIDAPGYYNGDLKPKGGADAGTEKTKTKGSPE